MSTAFKATLVAFAISLVSFLTPHPATCAEGTSKLVTRVDFARVDVKGGKTIVRAQGAGHSKKGAQLVPHKGGHELNKDGLLEFDFIYTPSAKDGDKLVSIIVTRKEPSTFVGMKGARIYTQYNELNAMLPAPAEKKKRGSKKEPIITEKKEPELKKEEALPKKEQPALKKQEPAVTKEKPTPKKEEQTAKKEEAPAKKEETKKKSRWRYFNPLNWNPFHKKPVEPEQ